jgi:hypothetical protein
MIRRQKNSMLLVRVTRTFMHARTHTRADGHCHVCVTERLNWTRTPAAPRGAQSLVGTAFSKNLDRQSVGWAATAKQSVSVSV